MKIKPKVAAPIEDVPVNVKESIPKLTDMFTATVISQAINPQWVYIRGKDGNKIPVIIPRKFSGMLLNKSILIEAISDNTGTSYRYVESSKG